MTIREDSDIKIFSSEKNKNQDGGILSFVEGMNHHRQNGNVDKAKLLGLELGKEAMNPSNKNFLSDEVFMSEDIFPQVCALLMFSAEAALNYFLPSQQLSTIAINSLHEKLSESKSTIYDDVTKSPAFSFYYLSVRKGGTDIPRDIGEAFAMLCRHEGDEQFIEEGKKLYNYILNVIEEKISAIDFAN